MKVPFAVRRLGSYVRRRYALRYREPLPRGLERKLALAFLYFDGDCFSQDDFCRAYYGDCYQREYSMTANALSDFRFFVLRNGLYCLTSDAYHLVYSAFLDLLEDLKEEVSLYGRRYASDVGEALSSALGLELRRSPDRRGPPGAPAVVASEGGGV